MTNRENQRGYIAFITVLLISALVMLVGVSTSLLSVNDLLSSYAGYKNEETIDLAESCAEDALLSLNENGTLPSSLTIDSNQCTITTNSQTGTTWDFTIETPNSIDYKKRIRIVAERTTSVAITSWLEQ
jgi:hypothetical protein